MKTLTYPLLAVLLAAGLLTGTAYAAPDDEAPLAAEEMAAEETNATEREPEGREMVAAGEIDPESEGSPHFAGTPNPMIEYPDVPALERAIGFPDCQYRNLKP